MVISDDEFVDSCSGGACILHPRWYSTICHQKDCCRAIECLLEMIAMRQIVIVVNSFFSKSRLRRTTQITSEISAEDSEILSA